MGFGGGNIIMDIYANIDLLLLVFVRFLGIFVILPVFSGQNIPMVAKLGLALGISVIFMANGMTVVPDYFSMWEYFGIIVNEFITGFILAFVVYVMFSIFYFVGQLVDYQIGFSMVSVYDPITQIQAPITGNLYYLMVCALFIQTGGLSIFLSTMFQSYNLLPIEIGRAHV